MNNMTWIFFMERVYILFIFPAVAIFLGILFPRDTSFSRSYAFYRAFFFSFSFFLFFSLFEISSPLFPLCQEYLEGEEERVMYQG